eukprot:NODE_66_length_3564_cov_104.388336_g58_i0.p1 GENE.NODE_66_length_3564_cov_104.388336_g58_i0~~NODE_66_length_3564_cov_104.388336_g58_i0.p1  ORF type:complete len:947 (-),score=174.35 NODE_66_length_3564_cov_104.388336_g58_i0:45-2885(-)
MSDKRIRVACRVRPRINFASERYEAECCRKIDDSTIVIAQPVEDEESGKQHHFSFDFVFDESDTQASIYSEAVVDLVDACLEGHSATILAYGQTGSGKTYTVLGDGFGEDASVTAGSGLFLRCLTDLFTYKERSKSLNVTISLSVIEIYLDKFFDLLEGRAPLALREADDGVNIPNLKTVEVEKLSDVFHWYHVAMSQRRVTSTSSNATSSRSHAIFLVDLVQSPKQSQNPLSDSQSEALEKRSSRLCLADLAGSERVKRSGVDGQALQEAQFINKSLSALGNVVNAMYKEARHISFRDSKLTRLLRSSFIDPSCRLLFVTNITPTASSFAESLCSLRFADRVKELKAETSQGMDTAAEQEFLVSLKLLEELASDTRIACQTVDFKISRALQGGRASRPELAEWISTVKARVAKELSEREEKEAAEIRNRAHMEAEEQLQQWRTQLEAERQQLLEANEECSRLTEESAKLAEDHKIEEEVKMKEAKRFKKERRSLEERMEVVKTQLVALQDEGLRVEQELKLKHQEVAGNTAATDEDWEQSQGAWAALDGRWAIGETFFNKLLRFRREQLDFAVHLLKIRMQLSGLQRQLALTEVQEIIDDLIAAAVGGDVSSPQNSTPCRQLKSPTLSSRFTPSSTGAESEEDSDDEAQLRPSAMVGTTVSAERTQRAFRNTPQDADEADRQYLMGIYDTPNLIRDILKYLQSGTILLKHCRSGKPHFRRFWLSLDLKEMHWVDPENPKAGGSSVSLLEVTDLLMGQYSKVFRRNRSDMTNPEFYLSFTLVWKQGKRTLDVVAETTSEFEAWLMGLCHVTGLEPRWKKQLDISLEADFEKLDGLEQESCSEHHITPRLFLKLKELIVERQREVKQAIKNCKGDMIKVYQTLGGIHPPKISDNGSLLMTKGELRYLANIDIFRSCVIWKILEHQQLIFDPNFTEPTPVVRKQLWHE